MGEVRSNGNCPVDPMPFLTCPTPSATLRLDRGGVRNDVELPYSRADLAPEDHCARRRHPGASKIEAGLRSWELAQTKRNRPHTTGQRRHPPCRGSLVRSTRHWSPRDETQALPGLSHDHTETRPSNQIRGLCRQCRLSGIARTAQDLPDVARRRRRDLRRPSCGRRERRGLPISSQRVRGNQSSRACPILPSTGHLCITSGSPPSMRQRALRGRLGRRLCRKRAVGDRLVPSRRALRARIENARAFSWQPIKAAGNSAPGNGAGGRPQGSPLRFDRRFNGVRICSMRGAKG